MSEFLHQVRQPEPADLDVEFCESIITIDGETFCYLTVPYLGCKKNPPCKYCGYTGTGTPGLQINERWQEAVRQRVDRGVAIGTDTLVLFNNGNILNPAEMDPTMILEYAPKTVASSPSCKALEIEIVAKDLLSASAQEKLQTIRKNLSGKELRLRVAVEYANDKLLSRNLKGVTMKDIDAAVAALSSAGIPWIGYAMLGGVEMTSEEARNAAIQTGKFIIDRGARRLALNGLFVTKEMKAEQERTGERIYIPTMEDLMEVLGALSNHRVSQNQQIPIKVGLDEVEGEDRRVHVVEYPYGIPVADPKERRMLMDILSDFDRCQAFETFQVEVIRNWARTEASRRLSQ